MKLHHMIKFIKFGFVAVLSLIFELVVYTFLFEGLKISPLTSTPLAQVASMIFNFSLNKIFTFNSKSFSKSEILRYIAVWILNVLISTLLMAIILENTNIYPTIVRFFVILIMFIVNFIALNKFVFRK